MEEVTYKQISQFRKNSRAYLGSKDCKLSKLSYAINKMLQRTEQHNQDYIDKEQQIRIELAESDKATGTLIITKENGYSYNKANAGTLTTKLRELADTKVSVEPYIATELPTGLAPFWYEFFVPFVIKDAEP